MEFAEFVRRFGGSFRTKNYNEPHQPIWKKTVRNSRTHFQPGGTELPLEFIRQDPWEAEYLFMVAQRAKFGILEIGRYNGGSLLLMAAANEAVPIYSVDIQPQDDKLLLKILLNKNLAGNVRLLVGDSQRQDFPEVAEFDLLFIDGDHSYEGCSNDLRQWYPKLRAGGHLLLHDSYFGSPVMDACVDFMDREQPVVHVSPFKHSNHATHPCGSMAHFQKRP